MSVRTLTEQILRKISKISPWQYRFMTHLLSLWLALRGRYTFSNLSRWGQFGEDTYRHNFGRSFDWLAFNATLVREQLDGQRIIAFDPSFLPKSGKHTPGLGYFYSGCARRELRGLEFGGIAAISLTDKTALHLEAVQTVNVPAGESLLAFYGRILSERSETLLALSPHLVADAYFAREPFISTVTSQGFVFTTRLRKDIRLRYLYHGPQRPGKGRHKTYDGRINARALRMDQFTPCARAEDDSWIAYQTLANVQAWKRNVRLVVVHHRDAMGKLKNVTLYACTDTTVDGADVLYMYGCRFQIEFLYRDAKQYTGLTHCQARSEDKLHFHLNTALSAVSLAKVAHHLDKPAQERGAFSMADIKTQYANELLLDRFIATFGNHLDVKKMISLREQLRKIGSIAA